MTNLAYLPISLENANAYESDIKACSEIYHMNSVIQINKIAEVIDGELQLDYPLYSIVKKSGYHNLMLDRSIFILKSINQVLILCEIWTKTESIEDIDKKIQEWIKHKQL